MNNRFAVRKINYQGSVMINICDEELIDRKVSEGKLEINITKDYFGQQMVEENEAAELLHSCAIANLIGERIVGKAVGMKLASSMSVRTISGVPFLMIFKFQH
jgi:hypothetical protein